jgi:hypothetical protein
MSALLNSFRCSFVQPAALRVCLETSPLGSLLREVFLSEACSDAVRTDGDDGAQYMDDMGAIPGFVSALVSTFKERDRAHREKGCRSLRAIRGASEKN